MKKHHKLHRKAMASTGLSLNRHDLSASRPADRPDGNAALSLNQQTMQWVNGYVGNFANMTTPKVSIELPKHFSGDPLTWVKQQFAKNHLGAHAEAGRPAVA